jgi:lipoprotein NlpD
LPVTPAPRWTWPADGSVLGSVQQPNGGIGLEIDGATGSDVRAAAAGRVVYTGAGLRGYGQLVIVKHDEAWLTAYGYNSAVYVAEGDAVQAGQRIAAMGEGPGRRSRLYFEIRLNGRPVDPLTQLPTRR